MVERVLSVQERFGHCPENSKQASCDAPPQLSYLCDIWMYGHPRACTSVLNVIYLTLSWCHVVYAA